VSVSQDERHYVRAVEAAWSQTLGRAVVISPREFEAVDAWRRRGIPLSVVLETIAATAKRRSGRTPTSLASLTQGILEAWSVIASGRATPQVSDELPARSDARRAWHEALARCPPDQSLHSVLSSLLALEAKGEAAEAIDAALDAALPASVPDELVRRVTQATERELEPFRARMQSDEFQRMFARARIDGLRSELRLPRLTLTR
jgi:hypothetical protein